MKIVAMAVDYINETLRVAAKLEEILVGPVYEDIKGKSCLLDTVSTFGNLLLGRLSLLGPWR